MKKTTLLLTAITFLLLLTGCAEFGDAFSSPGYNSGYNSGYRDSGWGSSDWEYEQRRRNDRERYELDRERRRLEEERRRVREERHDVWSAPAEARAPRVERCPSGFSPSENKCSVEERRRGCKDMRLPGGLGCVRR